MCNHQKTLDTAVEPEEVVLPNEASIELMTLVLQKAR